MVFSKCNWTWTFKTFFTMLIILSMTVIIQSLPIENGFTIKFSPKTNKDDAKSMVLGTILTKANSIKSTEIRRNILNNSPYLQRAGLQSQTDQTYSLNTIQRQHTVQNVSRSHPHDKENYQDWPLIKLPYNNYKILVATAPPNVQLTSEKNRRVLVYVVFPEGNSGDNVPSIYFVNDYNTSHKAETVDPIILVDNNRTITNLRSKEISKAIKFKNKLLKQYDYKTTN